jgi:hypothetical protein
VLIAGGEARINEFRSVLRDAVPVFGEKERRLALVIAKFADMFEVIASDALEAPHRKHLIASSDGQRDLWNLENLVAHCGS